MELLERRDAPAVVAALESIVNETTTGSQATDSRRAVAIADDGQYVVVWSGNGPGDGNGVFARVFAADGSALTDEFLVNQFTTGSQQSAAVAMDADGDFVVAWQSAGQDGSGLGVFARRYDAVGNALDSEFQVNQTAAGDQRSPSVAMAAGGDFVVVWESNGQDGSGQGVYARLYDAAGIASSSETQVNTFTTNSQQDPSVAMDADGNFVVAWHSDGQDGSGYGIYARRFDAAGAALSGEFQVNQVTSDSQAFASVAMDADGDFVIAWDSRLQDGSSFGIYARQYDAIGNALDGEFLVNQTTTGSQSFASVAVDADGGFVVVWEGSDGSSEGVYAQRYDDAGNTLGGEFQVNQFTTNRQRFASVAVDADGDFVIAWKSFGQDGDSYGAYHRRYILNAPPTTTGVPDQTATEDDAPDTLDLALSFDDVEDGAGGLTYTIVGNTNPGLVAVTVNGTVATLTYAANANGVADITVRATDIYGEFVEDTFRITVSEVNDAPTAADDTLSDVAENSGPRTISFATLLGNDNAGPANESGQSLTITAVGSAVGGTVMIVGTNVVFTPAANFHGTASFTYTVQDDGTTAGSSDPLSATAVVQFAVTPVNDAPSFTVGSNQTVAAGSGPQVVSGWATGISAGPVDEAGQALSFTVTGNTNPGLFAAGPAVAPDGTLTFTPAANADGTAVITLTLTDAGGATATATFTVTITPPPVVRLHAVAAASGSPTVVVYDDTGAEVRRFLAYDASFAGGVVVATGDVTGDGVDDIVVGSRLGSSHVKVFDGASGQVVRSFLAYQGFGGGVSVAVGDVTGDGIGDIVVGSGFGSSHVKVFDGATGQMARSFLAFSGFVGGVSVAAGDLNGDGVAEVIVGTALASSHVKAFNGATGAEVLSFLTFPRFTGGVTVAAGDLDGDGFAEILVGANANGHAKAFNADGSERLSFRPYPGFGGAIRVASVDTDGDGKFEIVTGGGPHVKRFDGQTLSLLDSFYTFDPSFTGGIFVG